MTKTNISCPRCSSDDLYKFGFNKHGHQKYQCKDCKRQFAPETLKETKPKHRKYASCPKCGKATFLQYDYKYYYNLRCCDKSCTQSFYVPKYKSITLLLHKLKLSSKFNFKSMRYSPYTILLALYTYFLHASNNRKVSKYLVDFHNIKVFHVTIAAWTKKFAPLFMAKSEQFKPD